MTVSTFLAVAAFSMTLILNVGGWLWFFATLKAKVIEIEAKILQHAVILNSLPLAYVPRSEIELLRKNRDERDTSRDEKLNEMREDIKHLLEIKREERRNNRN